MTRKEQIIAKAGKDSEKFYKVNVNYGHCFHGGFIDGAQWADKTMIDKVCNLIEENIDYACLHLGNYMMKEVDAKELSEWIRKAMEK